jgi:membrane protein
MTVLERVRSVRKTLLARVRSWRLGVAALDAKAGYSRHATSQLAAAISYRMLFSLVPLLALFASIISLVAPDEARHRIGRWLASVIPGTGIEESVQRTVSHPGHATAAAGLIAIPALLLAASGMMAAMRTAFRVIFDSTSERPYIRGKLLDFALVLATGVLMVTAFGLALFVEILAELGRDLSELLQAGSGGRALALAVEILASQAVVFVVFLLLYRSVPPARPRFAALWLPALLGSAAFQIATAGYAFYLARWGNITSIYGPLGAVLGFLLVIYIGVLVLLIGAELVAAWPTQTATPRRPVSP